MVVSGRKLFRSIRVYDTDLFENNYYIIDKLVQSRSLSNEHNISNQTMQPTVDMFRPENGASNIVEDMVVYETILEPGDMIFNPPWALHAGINLVDNTVSVAGNFIHPSKYLDMTEHCYHQHPHEDMNGKSRYGPDGFCEVSHLRDDVRLAGTQLIRYSMTIIFHTFAI